MNPLNYASLKASKRLVEAGIWLETEWYSQIVDGEVFLCTLGEKFAWEQDVKRGYVHEGAIFIPRPCMAEVWRELPFGDWELYQLIRKYLMFRGLDFEDYSVAMELIRIAKSTDALIDLLIWVRKEAHHDPDLP